MYGSFIDAELRRLEEARRALSSSDPLSTLRNLGLADELARQAAVLSSSALGAQTLADSSLADRIAAITAVSDPFRNPASVHAASLIREPENAAWLASQYRHSVLWEHEETVRRAIDATRVSEGREVEAFRYASEEAKRLLHPHRAALLEADTLLCNSAMAEATRPFADLASSFPMAHRVGADETVARLLAQWSERPGYADTFSALGILDTSLSATGYDLNSFAKVFGDTRAVTISSDFLSSPDVRTRAYLDAGFDAGLLKPRQSDLAAMLTLNGFADPSLWARVPAPFIVPRPRSLRQVLQQKFRPTPLQRKAYDEVGQMECFLRYAIHYLMASEFGDDWFMDRAPKALAGKLNKRKERGENVATGSARLDDADFAHYIEIILDPDNWARVFSFVFDDPEDARAKLDLFKALRASVCHYKGFQKSDFVELRGVYRWFEVKMQWVADSIVDD